jgi:hypothetical protein
MEQRDGIFGMADTKICASCGSDICERQPLLPAMRAAPKRCSLN